jgi:hypothetical protein
MGKNPPADKWSLGKREFYVKNKGPRGDESTNNENMTPQTLLGSGDIEICRAPYTSLIFNTGLMVSPRLASAMARLMSPKS